MIVFMAACGNDNTSADSSDQNEGKDVTADEVNGNPDEKQEEQTEHEEQVTEEGPTVEVPEYDEKTGEGYVDGLGYLKTLGVGYNDEVGIDGTDGDLKPLKFGDMELTINHVEVAEIEPDEDGPLFDINGKAKVIVIDMKTENTSDKDLEFYPTNSVLVTDTGLQLEDSDMFLTDDIDGEFYGKIEKEGIAWWILDDDVEADKIKSIKMIIDPAYTMDDYEDISEGKRIEFEILNHDDAYQKDKDGGMN